jgi:hypothetical protein
MRHSLWPGPAIIFLGAACGGGAGVDEIPAVSDPTTYIRYELMATTHELSPQTLAAIQSVGIADGAVRFAGKPAALSAIAKNEVIVAGVSATTPRGLLRQVVAIRDEGGDLIFDTQPVAIQLAFKHLHARGKTSATQLDGLPAATTQHEHSGGFTVGGGQDIDWQVFDQDGDRATKDDQLYVTGGVNGTVTVTASLDLDWIDDPVRIVEELACAALVGIVCHPSLPDVKLGVSAEVSASVSIDAEGAAATSFVSQTMPIEGTNVSLPPIPLGPVVLCPEIDFVSQIEGSSNARFHARAGMDYRIRTGASIGLLSGLSFDPPAVTRSTTPPVVETSLTATLKASIGPRISVRAWDAVGPQIAILGYCALAADRAQTPCFSVGIGADLQISLSLRVPWGIFGAEKLADILGLSGDIFHYSFPKTQLFEVPDAATGACSALPSSIYPPGEGPGEAAYLAPAFIPWSARFTDVTTKVYQFPYSGLEAEHLIHTDRAVDGSWLVSGEGLYGVAKVSESGAIDWMRQITLLGQNSDELDEPRPKAIARQARSTRIWVATSRFVVAQLDQEGDVVLARRFTPDVSVDPQGTLGDSLAPSEIIPTEDGGVLVVYDIRDTPEDGPAVLLRLDEHGRLVWSRALRFETDKTYVPAALRAASGFDLFGFSWLAGAEVGHAIHLDEDGAVTSSRRIDACGNPRVRPTRAIRLASGAIAFVGAYDLAPQRAFLAELAPDLTLAGAHTWETGSSLMDLAPTAVVQLPITGFLTASSVVPTHGARVRVAQHDARGVLLGEHEYASVDGATPRNLFPGDIRLTTDGGLLLFAAQGETPTSPGGLWLSKIPANTATFDPTGTDLTVAAVTSSASVCALSLADSPLSTTSFPVKSADFTANFRPAPGAFVVEKLLPR